MMMVEFVALEQGLVANGLYEGDDALFSCDKQLDPAIFLSLGFRLKIEKREDLYQSGFCGMSFSRDLCSFTDPKRVLMTLGWTTSRLKHSSDVVLLGLLRAKAFSLLYEHPRCPILSVLAHRILELTRGLKMRFEHNWYDQTVQHEAVKFENTTAMEYEKGVSLEGRLSFEHLYSIPVSMQLAIEHFLQYEWIGGVLDHPLILLLFESSDFDDCRLSADRLTTTLKNFY
jgi:hypothetical protein